MMTTDKKLLALGFAAAVAAAAVATAGLRRPVGVWSEPANLDSTYGMNGAVAILDAPADRVVLLVPGTNQNLKIEHVRIGRHVLNGRAVAAGQQADGCSRPATARGSATTSRTRARRLTVISCGDAVIPPALRADDADRSARRHRDRSDRGALGGLYPNDRTSALVQNPNELAFLDLAQPPETATVVAHTLHSFGGRPQRLTFTQTLSLPGGARRLLVVESDQDLSLLDSRQPEQRDLRAAHQRHR
jgi:hypothetical protein